MQAIARPAVTRAGQTSGLFMAKAADTHKKMPPEAADKYQQKAAGGATGGRLPRGFELDVDGVQRAPVSRLDARLLF